MADVDSQLLVLRSRVDQQAELIMLLKQRAEDAGRERDAAAAKAKQVAAELAIAQNQATRQEKACAQARQELDKALDNFGTLNENHEKIIKLKDEYKVDCAKLRARCQALEETAAAGKSERLASARESARESASQAAAKEGQLKSRVEALEAKLQRANAALKRQQGEAAASASKGTAETAQLKARAAELEKQCAGHAAEVAKLKRLAASRKTQAEKEAAAHAEALAGKDAKLRARGAEVEELKQRCTSAEEEALRAQAAAEDAACRAKTVEARIVEASADHQVKAVRSELEAVEYRLASLTQEYAAFKKHSSTQLDKERKLNERLRHLAEQ